MAAVHREGAVRPCQRPPRRTIPPATLFLGNEPERPVMSAHDHRTSPLPFFALLAVFTIAVITAALYVSFGHHP